VDLRLLVHQSQAGCIIGKSGFKIKELREVSVIQYYHCTFKWVFGRRVAY
jgi:heterogeneous nuclear ribonucleoprotein K